jgi:sec-independent protein translocase protein TatC
MALVKLDVLNYKLMKGSRAWAAIIICVVAAIITPTQDALTLGLLAVPMYVLYEICIWLAWWMEKKDRAMYPEYYKDQDADAKEVEVSDDWDNENYNPWNESGGDDEEATQSSTAAKSSPTSAEPGTSAGSPLPPEDSAPTAGETPPPATESAPAAEEPPPPAEESAPPEDAGTSAAPADDEPNVERRDSD